MKTQQFLDRIDFSACSTAIEAYDAAVLAVSAHHTHTNSEDMAKRIIREEWGIEDEDLFTRDYDRRVVLDDDISVTIRITECYADPGSEDYVYVVSVPGMDWGVYVEDGVNMDIEVKRFSTPEEAVKYAKAVSSHYEEAVDCYDTSKTQRFCVYAVVEDEPSMLPVWTSHYFYRDDF